MPTVSCFTSWMPHLLAGTEVENWPRPQLPEVVDFCRRISKSGQSWMSERDAALVAMIATFGKRAGENTSLRKKDVWTEGDRLFVRFTVSKITRPPRKRCVCGNINKSRWKFCSACGSLLSMAEELPQQRTNRIAVKSRVLAYPLVGFVTSWHKKVPQEEAFLFPPCQVPGFFGQESEPNWQRPLDRRAAGNILAKYERILQTGQHVWAHLFRHLLATKFSEEGYDEFDLMDWFDWSRYETAKRYVKLGGGKRIKRMGETLT